MSVRWGGQGSRCSRQSDEPGLRPHLKGLLPFTGPSSRAPPSRQRPSSCCCCCVHQVDALTSPQDLSELLADLSQQRNVALCVSLSDPDSLIREEAEGSGGKGPSALGQLTWEGTATTPTDLNDGRPPPAAAGAALHVPDPLSAARRCGGGGGLEEMVQQSSAAESGPRGMAAECGVAGIVLCWSHTAAVHFRFGPPAVQRSTLPSAVGLTESAAVPGGGPSEETKLQQRCYEQRIWPAILDVLSSPLTTKVCFAARQQVAWLDSYFSAIRVSDAIPPSMAPAARGFRLSGPLIDPQSLYWSLTGLEPCHLGLRKASGPYYQPAHPRGGGSIPSSIDQRLCV